MAEQFTKQVRQHRLRGKAKTTVSQYLAYARQCGHSQDKWDFKQVRQFYIQDMSKTKPPKQKELH